MAVLEKGRIAWHILKGTVQACLSSAWCVLLPVLLIALQVYVNGSFDMASRTYGVNPLLAYTSNIGGCIMVMRIMQWLVKESEAFPGRNGPR